MSAKVALLVTQGPLKGSLYTFTKPTECVLGRGLDCRPRFPDDEAHQTISRHHCRIWIDPPRISVRDLGSLNGTWINGRIIGHRKEGQTLEQAAIGTSSEYELKDGDEVRLGETVLVIRASGRYLCPECGVEMTTDQLKAVRLHAGPLLCASCRSREEKTLIQDRAPVVDQDSEMIIVLGSPDKDARANVCMECGGKLTKRAGFTIQSDILCASCQHDPLAWIKILLARTGQGDPSLAALQGLSLIKPLGRGAAGAAFLVRHVQTGELMALKLMLPEVALNERARNMFLREVENSRVLDHPNVVKMFDSGSYEGIFFYTMEFCDGGSLDNLLVERGGKVPLKEAVRLVLQALDGLDYIHNAEIPIVKLADGTFGPGRGLVHRDIKPANIFLSSSDSGMTPKIADIGVAKAYDTAGMSGQTRTGAVAGTPVSMPRQQVINFKYAKPDVDVWAMAATFYRILTGKYPRDFPPNEDPCLVVLRNPAVPIRQRDPLIPEKLAEVIDYALIDQPAITFQSAAAFKQALEEAL